MSWFSEAFKWIKVNVKWVLLGLVSILLFVVCFSWYRKNRLIRKLKNEILILQAKVKLERLAVEHDVLVEKLKEIRKENAFIETGIQVIEESLQKKLESDMTADEIIAAFKKTGLTQ